MYTRGVTRYLYNRIRERRSALFRGRSAAGHHRASAVIRNRKTLFVPRTPPANVGRIQRISGVGLKIFLKSPKSNKQYPSRRIYTRSRHPRGAIAHPIVVYINTVGRVRLTRVTIPVSVPGGSQSRVC